MNQSLPITSLERFHLFDDYPQFPNTIGCQLRITGELDLELANKALRKAVDRHRFTKATADSQFRNWRFEKQARAAAAFETLEANEKVVAVPVDPQTDGGGRCLWQATDDGVRLLFVTHHALVDGQGGMQFIIDWMTAYHNLVSDERIQFRKLEPGLLRKRNRLGLFSKAFFSRIWLQPVAVFGSAKFMARKIVSLGTEESSGSSEASCQTELATVTLDVNETKLLREVAEAEGYTVNELLLRDVFMALHKFRCDSDRHRADEWLRIVVPMSIRTYSDRRMPAVNRATIVQLDRTDKDFTDREQLVWGIRYELGKIRKWQLDKTFLIILRMFSKVPGRLKRIAQAKVCRATTVLTNLAAPFERTKLHTRNGKIVLGAAVVEDFDLIAPLRPLTPLAIAVSKYAGEMKLSIHFHADYFEREEADLLVEQLIQQLDRTLGSLDR